MKNKLLKEKEFVLRILQTLLREVYQIENIEFNNIGNYATPKIKEVSAITFPDCTDRFTARIEMEIRAAFDSCAASPCFAITTGHFVRSHYPCTLRMESTANMNAAIRSVVEIMCSRGHIVSIQDLKRNNRIYLYFCKPTSRATYHYSEAMEHITFVPKNKLKGREFPVDLPSFPAKTGRTLPELRALRELRWKHRRNALLMAKRFHVGDFFHVLKYVALYC